MVAVCPIEHELYYTEDEHLPLEKVNEAQQKALQSNGKFTILHTNLVLGKDSYLAHYLSQAALVGKVPSSILTADHYKYQPISSDDLTQAVEAAFTNFTSAKGKRFNVYGRVELSLKELIEHIARSVGKNASDIKPVKPFLNLGLSDFIEEFFVGIAHDKNMTRMAEYFEAHKPVFENADFFKEFNLSHKSSVGKVYEKQIKEEDLIHPIFSNYKMTSLD